MTAEHKEFYRLLVFTGIVVKVQKEHYRLALLENCSETTTGLEEFWWTVCMSELFSDTAKIYFELVDRLPKGKIEKKYLEFSNDFLLDNHQEKIDSRYVGYQSLRTDMFYHFRVIDGKFVKAEKDANTISIATFWTEQQYQILRSLSAIDSI